MTNETDVTCPFCYEIFSIVVDCSEDRQTYIEDCFVCCRPIEFYVSCGEGELISVEASRSV
jgi:hypothetical protein